jgi:hypothetical protein
MYLLNKKKWCTALLTEIKNTDAEGRKICLKGAIMLGMLLLVLEFLITLYIALISAIVSSRHPHIGLTSDS